MKRLIEFSFDGNSYQLLENHEVIFSIDEASLKFDSLKFYRGVYEGKSSAIELINTIADNPQKYGNYIFTWIKAIVDAIHLELNDPEPEQEATEEIGEKEKRIIPLYDFSVCAGNGDFADDSIEHSDFETSSLEADYALRISGQSMEPTIQDHDIVLVKRTATQIEHNDIVIVSVDGEIMCKRFIKRGRGEFLIPDNKEDKYKEFSKRACTSYVVLGKVIEIIHRIAEQSIIEYNQF